MDEWTGTLTLTEASSNELLRVLEEQDTAFMNDLFDGKCGVTLRCADGRIVKLIPWERKCGYWREVYCRKGPRGPERTLECCNCQKRRVIKIGEAFPAYCEHCGSFNKPGLT